jgi:hypothetical protein
MLSASNKLIMPSVIVLNVVMLSVVAPFYKCNFERLSKLACLKHQ